MTEAVVVPFRRPQPLVEKSILRHPDGPADFELRYVRDPQSNDWRFGIDHTENYAAAHAFLKLQLRCNPQTSLGLEGICYVDFIPLSMTAQHWLRDNGRHQEPRLHGKLAVIDLIARLRRAGFVLHKVVV